MLKDINCNNVDPINLNVVSAIEVAEEEAEHTTAVKVQYGGGCAGIEESRWRHELKKYDLSEEELQEEVQQLRHQLLEQQDVNKVYNSLRAFGIILDKQLVAVVKHYNFDSPGLCFTFSNYLAWTKLANGKGIIDDARYFVHEMAEVRELQEIQQLYNFDFMGTNLQQMSRKQKQQWKADFENYYMQAHRKALNSEYEFMADQVFHVTNRTVTISPTVVAAVDPDREEARLYMLVEGVPLQEHPHFESWKLRAKETVELGQNTLAKLRLYTNPTLAELVSAVKLVKLK